MLVIKQMLLNKQFHSGIIILTYIYVSTRGERSRSDGGSNEPRRCQKEKKRRRTKKKTRRRLSLNSAVTPDYRFTKLTTASEQEERRRKKWPLKRTSSLFAC